MPWQGRLSASAQHRPCGAWTECSTQEEDPQGSAFGALARTDHRTHIWRHGSRMGARSQQRITGGFPVCHGRADSLPRRNTGRVEPGQNAAPRKKTHRAAPLAP